jgi:hypothetical protein
MPTTTVIVLLLILLFFAAMVFAHKYYSGELDLSEFFGSQKAHDMPIIKAENQSVKVVKDTEYLAFGNPDYYYLDDGSGRIVARFTDIKGNKFDVYVPQYVMFLLNKNENPPHVKHMPKCTVKAYSSTEIEAEVVDYLGEFYVTKRSILDFFKYRNGEKTTDQINDTLFRQTLVFMLPECAIIKKAVKVNNQHCNLYAISDLATIGVTPKRGSAYPKYIKQGDNYEVYQNTP